MKILVTGGGGFLGSHLCDRLLNDGHYVICLDNLFTGSKDNIKHLSKHRNFEFIRHDVTQPIILEVDQVYNLACPASPKHYQRYPVKTIKTSVIGTINLLDLAKDTGARIFQASTSEVYGSPEVHPQSEDYWGHVNPIGIRSCYDEGKRCAEALFMDYHRQYGLDIRIARIFNTYGSRLTTSDGRVVSNFIVQALQGKDITIYGTGEQTRSFCYIDDSIEGFIKLMNTEGINTPVNLGNPNEISMLDLAKLILKLTDSKSNIVFEPLPYNDPIMRKPDITLAKKLLHWEPKVSLENGLLRVAGYFRVLLKERRV